MWSTESMTDVEVHSPVLLCWCFVNQEIKSLAIQFQDAFSNRHGIEACPTDNLVHVFNGANGSQVRVHD